MNKNPDALTCMSSPSDENNQGQILDALRKNHQVVLMAVNQIEGDVTFFHNVQELSGGVGSSFVSLVGLQGWGVEAMTVQLEHHLFHHKTIVDCPAKDDLWTST